VSKKRKPSIKTIERQTGKVVTSVTYSIDGNVTYSFGESATRKPNDDVEAWINRHAN
jgi:hypothetical protein